MAVGRQRWRGWAGAAASRCGGAGWGERAARRRPPAPCFSAGGRCRAWRMMNFRQRMGWIGVGLYLLASAAAFYYVFEINETYNKLALEHIQQHPKEPQEGTTWTHSLKVRLLSLPFWLWTIIFLIPYLQMFLFLYSCTRADPKTVGYCIIPICLAVICNRHQTFVKASNQISRLQLIDT